MEDFNSDNAKIDAALAKKLERKLLYRFTVQEDAASVEVPLKGNLDWNASNIILMKFTSAAQNNAQLVVYTNKSGGGHYKLPRTDHYNGFIEGTMHAPIQALLFPGQDAEENNLMALAFSTSSCTLGTAGYSAIGITSLTLKSSSPDKPICAGSTLEFWELF